MRNVKSRSRSGHINNLSAHFSIWETGVCACMWRCRCVGGEPGCFMMLSLRWPPFFCSLESLVHLFFRSTPSFSCDDCFVMGMMLVTPAFLNLHDQLRFCWCSQWEERSVNVNSSIYRSHTSPRCSYCVPAHPDTSSCFLTCQSGK